MKTRKALAVALAAILLAAGVFTNPVAAQSGRALFNWVITDRALVQDGGLTVTGSSLLANTAIVGTESVSGNATFATNVILTPATAISVTMNMTITPAGAYQPLTSAGTVNTSRIAAGTAGTLLTLVNNSATTIVLTDTGTLKLSGNISLGQYDTLILLSDGTNWVQRSTSNN